MKTFKSLHPNSKNKVNLEEIIRIEADINYSHLVLTSGDKLILARTLKAYEKDLSIPFVRVNKSCMVNIHFLENFFTVHESHIRFMDGFETVVSRRRLYKVANAISNFRQ
ncbi:hypothetical protein GCM10011514_27270 [Emticicia aquatilis]|uniref:HTH LytTR-type domain-containing protein n=1 Tax=Emticicia aquatilis TaxID=1537369 RepID=A0A916YU15_9BACT|nr:LytTR family transcriptional regulator DNA-binding domain-containing protein [Emticicia aquatilis]GGD61767.1 hypothetical protein GCM10011514_27270 [Emticicia aquatilis]